MLERATSKLPIYLFLSLTILSLLCTISAIIISIIWKYTGFSINNNYNLMCNVYLSFKLQQSKTYLFNAVFFQAIISLLSQILLLIQLIFLLLKFRKSEDHYFPELSEAVIVRLYIGFSLSILGLIIGVGYYFSYIVQQGMNCLSSIALDWIIIGGIFLLALLALLVCWIYLLIFWTKNKHQFDEKIVQPQKKPDKVQYEEPINMINLFQEMKDMIKKEEGNKTRQLQQPLVQHVQEEDRLSEQSNMREKLVIIPFEQYKRQEEQKRKLKQLEQEKMKQILEEQEEKYMRQEHQKIQKKMRIQEIKKKIRQTPVSPDHPDFNKIFQESEQELPQAMQKQPSIYSDSQSQIKHFPANFLPKNQDQRQQFQKYKKHLEHKFYKQKHPNNEANSKFKHPQNIEGGRSKASIKKFLKEFKRPVRDETLYLKQIQEHNESAIESPPSTPKIKFAEKQKQNSPQKYGQFNVPEILQTLLHPPSPKKKEEKPFIINKRNQQQGPQPEQLMLHKSRTKSATRKKLFEQEPTFSNEQTFTSILGALIKGVEETNRKNKLKILREKREQSLSFKSKQTEKLIDSIRSRYH